MKKDRLQITETIKDNGDRVALLNRITTHIRKSLDLQIILDATVAEVRNLLGTDRVKIYKFDEDGNGQVIAEDLNSKGLPSLKGLHFPAGDIPPQARELFCKARTRSIVNIEQQEITLAARDRLPSTATGELSVAEVRQLELEELLKRPVDPCHVEYLSLMGVKSSLVIPILNENQLWGLLISHNATEKIFPHKDLQIVEAIAEQLELAISQANLLYQVKQKARREEAINRVFTLLHSTLETREILPQVLEETVNAIDGSGGTLLLVDPEEQGASFYTHGLVPQLLGKQWVKILNLNSSEGPIEVFNDLEREPKLNSFIPAFRSRDLRSATSVALKYRNEPLGSLMVFRQEIEQEKLWAGYQDKDNRQSRPRQSFEEWRELQKGRVKKWAEAELNLLQSVGNHLSMAVIQDRLYHQEKQQRLLVEMRNQQLERARQIAEEASRLKSNFLSSTSHELRTPLTGTLNYLKLLKEGFYDNPQELKEYIEAAYSSTENLVDIINDVLDISKIEAGKMSLEMKSIALKPLLNEQINIFKQIGKKNGVELHLNCDDVDRVFTDETKLKQIITNLLSNAFKFTDRGSVCLNVKRAKKAGKSLVVFSIRDTGIGIEPQKQELLFEAFVQGDGSIRRQYGGTGLGLSICKQLVELMGGSIELESAGKNLGTTVTFTLPDRMA
ncbi:MAG: ATP-binding protein [Prochloraceae cyanobacterium]